MKKNLLFCLFGAMMALCLVSCSSKEDTCCKVNITTSSDATINHIYLVNSNKNKEIGKYPGSYYIPYGKEVAIDFTIEYEYRYTDWRGDYQYSTSYKYATIKFPVNNANELDVNVGYYTPNYDDEPTPCLTIGGVRKE